MRRHLTDMKRPLFLLIAALPAAVALQVPGLHFASMEVIDGSAQAPLLGFVLTPAAAVHFHIEADNVLLQTESSTSARNAVALQPDAANRSKSYDHAVLDGTTFGTDGQLALFPTQDGQVSRLTAECGQFAPKGTSEFVWDSHVGTRHDFDHVRRTASQTTEWTPCETSNLVLSGNFTLALWSWNATLNGEAVSSGFVPAAPPLGAALGTDTQVVVFLTNAQVQLPVNGGISVYLEKAPKISNASSLLLRKAHGLLEGTPVDGSDLQLTGKLNATLASQPDGYDADIQGDIQQAKIDGQVLGMESHLSWLPRILAWSSLAMAGVLAWLFPVWRGYRLGGQDLFGWAHARSLFWADVAHRASDRNRFLVARFALSRGRRADGESVPLLTAQARMRWQQGAFADELLTHERLHPLLSTPASVASNAIQAARAAHHLGDANKAAAWYLVANQTDPELANLHMSGPQFEALRRKAEQLHYQSTQTPGYG